MREVLAALAGDVLRPDLVEAIVTEARTMFEAFKVTDARSERCRELAAVQREQARLTDAIAAGADAAVIVDRLRVTEAKRRDLVASLEASQSRPVPAWREIERQVRQSLDDWRSRFSGDDVAAACAGFRQLLTSPIMLTPFV